jgi:hypothetical protein
VGFFDLPEPDPGEDLEIDEDDDGVTDLRPARWVGGVVPVELVIARSDEAAVVASRVSAYPDGFELTLVSFLSSSVKPRRRRNLHHPMMWHDTGEPGEPLPDELLRFGLQWPDGGRATNLDGWGRSWPDATEPAHGLESRGGSGSGHEYAEEFWAWPLPADGSLGLLVEWPAFGIGETRSTIEASLFVAAADRARPVWPEDASPVTHLSRGAVMRSMQERGTDHGGSFADL